MNGRIYDPTLGKFLQADPHIQAPSNSQSYNRYSYVLNNPLSYTDPSGYFFTKLFNKVFSAINKVLGDLAPLASIALSIWAPWGTGFWASVGTGFVAGGIATGSLRGALTGAFTAGMFHGIGTHFQGLQDSVGVLSAVARIGTILAHGVAGGISIVLNGGKCGHGFASARLTQAFSGAIDKIGGCIGNITKGDYFSTANRAMRIVASAAVGGTASAITYGKFANGAITGAFSRGFNDEAHFQQDRKSFWDRFTNETKMIGNFIQDEGLNVLGRTLTTVGRGAQVLLGGALCTLGLGSAIGAPIATLGASNIQEGLTGQDGFVRDGAQALFGQTTGDYIVGGANLATSIGGLSRSVLAPLSTSSSSHCPSTCLVK